ncbi:UpxY family transcription antiterminator [Aquimarina sp. I32.4]|uniref:UpxY family transcription antiterminator n=1 Tax=Aquimarina sp. I32.4 TaxID=2053903 RepID=UPI000CDE7B11|nr:UpxY family transcription antiterminator [Aquimarina sp. I32.4]
MSKIFKNGWHVLYVRSCQEKKVHQLLQENHIESFLPLTKIIRKWSDRKKTMLKPLFPSYIFVNINSLSELHKALSVDGACSYISFGREYALLKKEEVKQIRFLVDQNDISDVKIYSEVLNVGDIRSITIGPLMGLQCEILKADNINKMIVRIGSLQQNIIATISIDYLSKLCLI